MNNHLVKIHSLVAATILASGAASADFTAQVSAQGDAGKHQVTLTLEFWRAATGRMTRMDIERSGYMLIRDGRAYMVITTAGVPIVMDLSAMAQSDGVNQASTSMGADEMKDVVSLEGLGGKEILAGIPGEIYKLTWRDGQGRERTDDIVLSGDPRALDLMQAWAHMIDVVKTSGVSSTGQEELISLISNKKMGWLRIGNRSRLTAFQQTKLSVDRFALPGPVMQLPLDQGVDPDAATQAAPADTAGAATIEGESEGLFGGLFGVKAERQQQRANNKVDENADSAVTAWSLRPLISCSAINRSRLSQSDVGVEGIALHRFYGGSQLALCVY